MADRLYLPTADGGRAITDAVTETFHLVNMARGVQGQPPLKPKDGARFHFELPGSVQGFTSEESTAARGVVTLDNVEGFSETGRRTLAIHCRGLAARRIGRAETPTFIPSRDVARYFERRGYRLLASPTIYPGQSIRARVVASAENDRPLQVSLYIKHYNASDELTAVHGDSVSVAPGQDAVIAWRVPDTHCYPIAFVGVEVQGSGGQCGTLQ